MIRNTYLTCAYVVTLIIFVLINLVYPLKDSGPSALGQFPLMIITLFIVSLVIHILPFSPFASKNFPSRITLGLAAALIQTFLTFTIGAFLFNTLFYIDEASSRSRTEIQKKSILLENISKKSITDRVGVKYILEFDLENKNTTNKLYSISITSFPNNFSEEIPSLHSQFLTPLFGEGERLKKHHRFTKNAGLEYSINPGKHHIKIIAEHPFMFTFNNVDNAIISGLSGQTNVFEMYNIIVDGDKTSKNLLSITKYNLSIQGDIIRIATPKDWFSIGETNTSPIFDEKLTNQRDFQKSETIFNSNLNKKISVEYYSYDNAPYIVLVKEPFKYGNKYLHFYCYPGSNSQNLSIFLDILKDFKPYEGGDYVEVQL